MRLDWKETKFDRGGKHEALTPFGPITIVDDGYRCMCIRHPLMVWSAISSPLTLNEVKADAEAHYFAAIETEYEERR